MEGGGAEHRPQPTQEGEEKASGGPRMAVRGHGTADGVILGQKEGSAGFELEERCSVLRR